MKITVYLLQILQVRFVLGIQVSVTQFHKSHRSPINPTALFREFAPFSTRCGKTTTEEDQFYNHPLRYAELSHAVRNSEGFARYHPALSWNGRRFSSGNQIT